MTKEEAKHLSDVLKAYSEDKAIEIKVNNKWVLYDLANKYQMGTPLRIKPEPKYRPYKNAEEFLKAQKEHGPYLKMGSGFYVNIFHINDSKINYIAHGGIKLNSPEYLSYTELPNYFTWQDGTPCGILEE